MRRPLSEQNRPLVDDEVRTLGRVQALLGRRSGEVAQDAAGRADFERELIALRDQIADEKQEDIPSLVEQMTRVQALAAGKRPQRALPVDAASPYFAHMRVRQKDGAEQEVLIGRRGLIERAAGVQIVDWRDAPISRVYYRYDEGDDYEEQIGPTRLEGEVLTRRNVTIAGGDLKRIGCPQGQFVSDGSDWFELEGQGVPLLEGGSGTAARPPRPQPRARGRQKFQTAAPSTRGDKHLPEIAALIDRDQFALITEPSSGVVVVQGGAGSGKTTVALHRIAYLVFHDTSHFRPSKCLVVVPSEALQRYVSGVLPALGVHGVPVVTFRSWAQNLRKRLVPSAPNRYSEETPPSVSRLKKHPAVGKLLARAVADEVSAVRDSLPPAALAEWEKLDGKSPAARLRILRGRIEKGQVGLDAAIARSLERELKLASSKLRDVRRLVWEMLTDRARLEELRNAKVEPAGARELDELVRWCSAQLDRATPPEAEDVTDEERIRPVDGGALEDAGGDGTFAAERLDLEDDALLLRAYQLVQGNLTRVDGEPLVYDHIAVDEAQDLSAIEIELLHQALSERRSMTIAGDVAQRVVFDNAFRGWVDLLYDIGITNPEACVRPLKLAYRSTEPVMRFARRVLGPLADGLDREIVARPGVEVSLHGFDGMGEAVGFVADALRSLLGREPSASVALIARHAGQADAWHHALEGAEVPMLRRVRRQDFPFAPGVDVTDVAQVKGLEFDYVILLDVNRASYTDTVESRHLLHIGATRTTHQLWLVSTGKPSELVEAAMVEEVVHEQERAG